MGVEEVRPVWNCVANSSMLSSPLKHKSNGFTKIPHGEEWSLLDTCTYLSHGLSKLSFCLVWGRSCVATWDKWTRPYWSVMNGKIKLYHWILNDQQILKTLLSSLKSAPLQLHCCSWMNVQLCVWLPVMTMSCDFHGMQDCFLSSKFLGAHTQCAVFHVLHEYYYY